MRVNVYVGQRIHSPFICNFWDADKRSGYRVGENGRLLPNESHFISGGTTLDVDVSKEDAASVEHAVSLLLTSEVGDILNVTTEAAARALWELSEKVPDFEGQGISSLIRLNGDTWPRYTDGVPAPFVW